MKVILSESQAKEPFSFAFVDDEGKTIVRSENYTAKKNALNGIESDYDIFCRRVILCQKVFYSTALIRSKKIRQISGVV